MRVKLDIPLKLKQICKMTNLDCTVQSDKEYEYICTDSREYVKGDLFWTLKGKKHDADLYTKEIIKLGGVAIGNVISNSCIYCTDANTALLTFAREYKRLLTKLKHTIAITGSVGKSTTKEFASKILSTEYKVHATSRNYNNEIGVPITILSASSDTEILVIECGMNHSGELSKLSECVEPDCIIITNIGTSHIGNLGSREMIAKAKLEILDHAKTEHTLIIPYDEPLLNIKQAITCSITNNKSDAHLKINSTEFNSTSFTYYFGGQELFDGICQIGGESACLDLAYALTAAMVLGVQKRNLSNGILQISNENTRQKVIKLLEFTIIDDSYNSSIESLNSGLKLLKLHGGKKLSVLLTDILELGEFSSELHIHVGKMCAEACVDSIYFYGQHASEIRCGALLAGYDEHRIFVSDLTRTYVSFYNKIIETISPGETIYAKGSHDTELHKIIELFKRRCTNAG